MLDSTLDDVASGTQIGNVAATLRRLEARNTDHQSQQPIKIMNKAYTHDGTNFIIQLGGIQITKEQLDAVKLAYNKDSDQDAVDLLVNCAERAFTNLIDSAEGSAYWIQQDNGGPEYISPDEHLSNAYCDAIKK